MEEKRHDSRQTIDIAVPESDAYYFRLCIDHSWAGLTFAPHFMAVLYGSHEASVGSSGARMVGAAIVALGVLAWVGRKQKQRAWVQRLAIIAAEFAAAAR